jgi:hypothetical protein
VYGSTKQLYRAGNPSGLVIQDEKSIDILKNTAQSKYPQVRVAVAVGLQNLKHLTSKSQAIKSDVIDNLLGSLNNDQDIGVANEVSKSIEVLRE